MLYFDTLNNWNFEEPFFFHLIFDFNKKINKLDSESSVVVAIKILPQFREGDDTGPGLTRIRVASAREGVYMPMLPQRGRGHSPCPLSAY